MAAPLSAQSPSPLPLANALSQAGSYEQALQIYLNLFNNGRHDYQVISGIKTSYEKLSRYKAMITFFQKLSRQNPQNIDYRLSLGQAYFLDGQKEQALKIWRAVYRASPPNLTRYRLVGLTLIRLNLYNEAIAVFREALQKVNNKETLYGDLARLYRAQLDYEQAAYYFLKYYHHYKNQQNYVRSQIVAMTRDKEAAPLLIKGVEKFKREIADDTFVEETEAALYIRLKNFKKAFAIYQNIQHQNPAKNFMRRFAEKAAANRAYDFALKAYRLLLQKQHDLNHRAPYLLRIAQIDYALARTHTVSERNQKYVRHALDQLKKLSATTLSAMLRLNSLELRGDIYHDYFNDADRAVSFYNAALKINPDHRVSDNIRLKLAKVYLEKNDLPQAQTFYMQVRSRAYLHPAAFQLARLNYFEGRFAAAQKQLNNLLNQTSAADTIVNNALKLSMFIARFHSDSLMLTRFALAELLQAQKHLSQAARAFGKLFEAKNALSAPAAIKAARLYIHLAQPAQAQKILETFLKRYPNNPQADGALFLLAGLLENVRPAQALKIYNTLLIHFPQSFYLEKTRAKARILAAKIKE